MLCPFLKILRTRKNWQFICWPEEEAKIIITQVMNLFKNTIYPSIRFRHCVKT